MGKFNRGFQEGNEVVDENVMPQIAYLLVVQRSKGNNIKEKYMIRYKSIYIAAKIAVSIAKYI